MEIRQLTYFLAAAQTQNFRKAADICLVAQPALSRQIAALEHELGVPLFERTRQRVILTAEGKEFAHYARSALEHLQQGQQALARLQHGEYGTVTIGCIEPLTTAFLPEIIPQFHQRYPNIRLKVRVDRTDKLLQLVEQGEVNLGLIFNPEQPSETLIIKELFQQPLQVLVSVDHPLARQAKERVTLRDLESEPLFLLNETSRLRQAVEKIFTRAGRNIQPMLEIESIAGLKAFIKQGAGITFMLEALLRPDELERDFKLLSFVDIQTEFAFALVYQRTGLLPLSSRHFINTIQDKVQVQAK